MGAGLADIDDQYEEVDPPQATATPGKIEVLEVFWYACPVCNRFRPYMALYTQTKPPYVALSRMPAMMALSMRPHAQAFYTGLSLKALDRTHEKMYDAIHKNGKKMTAREEIRELFVAQGVESTEFDKHYKSFSVDAQIRRATNLTEAYGITGTPSVIVNGKYLTSPQHAGGFEAMMMVIDVLVEEERKRIGLYSGLRGRRPGDHVETNFVAAG